MTLGQLRPLHWKGTFLLVFILTLLLSCGGGGGGGNAAPPAPDFSLSVSPPASIQAGASGSTQVSVTRSNGHSASLTLSLAANGPAITGSGTIAAGATAGTFTLNVPASAAPGAVTLTVNASDGTLTRSAAFTLTVTPGPDFSISVAPPPPIPAGGSGPGTVTVTRSGGHTAALTLNLATNAQNITGSGAIAASAASGNLLLTVPATVAPGAYTLTCNGYDGSLSRSVAFSLTVAAPPAFTFTLGASRVSALLGGTTAPVPLTLTRSGGFTAPVAFSVQGLPQGVSATFTPTTTAGSTSSLVLSAAVSAAPGTATLTVLASGGGVTQNAPLTFDVNPVPPTSVTLTTWVNGVAANTDWVAWRDGLNGAWTVLTGNSGIYSFTVTDSSGRFSLAAAYAGDASTGPQVKVTHAALGELKTPSPAVPGLLPGPGDPQIPMSFGTPFPNGPLNATHLTGTISNWEPNVNYEIVLRDSLRSATPVLVFPTGTPPSFSLDLPQSTYTGAVVERDSTGKGLTATILGNTVLTGPTSTLNIDRSHGFFNLQGFAPPIDVTRVLGSAEAIQAEAVPTDFGDSPATFLYLGAGGATLNAGFFPAAYLPQGWIHRVDAIAWNPDFSQTSWQTQFIGIPPVAPTTLAIPPLLGGVQVNAVAAPSGRKQVQVTGAFPTRSEMNVFVIRAKISQVFPSSLSFQREDRYTLGWLDPGSQLLAFTTVDLGWLPGWRPAWNITPGVPLYLTANTMGANVGLPSVLNFLERTFVMDGLTFNAQNFSVNFIP